VDQVENKDQDCLRLCANSLRRNSVYTQYTIGILHNDVDANMASGCSKRPDFSPAQPRRAETRLIPIKAAACEAGWGWVQGWAKIRISRSQPWP